MKHEEKDKVKFLKNDHCYVVLAYEESPHLRDCVDTLVEQSVKSNIIVATSTPNRLIYSICDEFGIELRVNPEQNGIASDFNFGYHQGESKLITLASQDCLYSPLYTEKVMKYSNAAHDPIILFSNYYQINDNGETLTNTALKIKRLMCLPWTIPCLWNSRFVRRFILAFGNPIAFPTVTMMRDRLPVSPFSLDYKPAVDYKLWVDLLLMDGEFVYIPDILVGDRISVNSGTANLMCLRKKEENEILQQLWPRPIANALSNIYGKAMKIYTKSTDR